MNVNVCVYVYEDVGRRLLHIPKKLVAYSEAGEEQKKFLSLNITLKIIFTCLGCISSYGGEGAALILYSTNTLRENDDDDDEEDVIKEVK